jgi:site-specific recombinase XerD
MGHPELRRRRIRGSCHRAPSRRRAPAQAEARPNLARATRENYAGTWDRHIGRWLGGYPLREITAPLLRRHLADMRARGVGPEAIKKTKLVLQSALRFAVEEGAIQGNPVQAVRLPSLRSARPSARSAPPTSSA